MATSPLFGWQEPDDTSLVKDGAAAIRTLGNAIDTSMGDLLGGTTGQVLAKASNTNMDFTWVTSAGDIEGVTAGTGISGGGTSGTVTITNSMATAITTNGDLIYGTGSGTFTRRGIGSSGQVLTVSGGVPAWVSPAGGGKVLQVVMGSTSTNVSTSSGTYTDTGLTATITPSATTSKVLVLSTQNGCFKNATSYTGIDMILVRNGSQVIQIAGGAGSNGVAENNLIPTIATSYLDSPASTSALTYKTQFRVSNGGTVGVQRNAEPTSSIILLEIGA